MTRFHNRLLGGAAALALLTAAGAARAQDHTFDIAPQPLASALNQFGAQSDTAVLVRPDLAQSKTTRGVTGAANAEVALNTLLEGTGLTWRRDGDTFLIVQGGSSDPQGASAAQGGATVEALIVTAQKREEDIQDVPIAISAFTQKELEAQKIEGGFDLLKAIPNVTFSKNNFTSYNFSIRGIGTKAVSATTDPGVAVSFNNTALLQNRLFEQEYFDIERVEVLRGPQGTLYGRNATAGVINVITAKPDLHDFDGWIKGEVGNYDTKRLSAMVNVPLVEDRLAVRLAGSLTDRQGYDYNSTTKHAVNGRDLWSVRATLAFEPSDVLRGNLIWERFEEDDNRSRTGKQLCHRDPGTTRIGDFQIDPNDAFDTVVGGAMFSQGCQPGSLYDAAAFGTPNGLAMAFNFGLVALGADCSSPARDLNCVALYPLGYNENGRPVGLLKVEDPYGGLMQSTDLRVIQSIRDPVYKAKADILQLNLDWDITDYLTFSSQTVYNKDDTYSFQDFNRFNTLPAFNDTSNLTRLSNTFFPNGGGPSAYRDIAPNGVFCDPQIGCSSSIAGFDIAQAEAEQFTQEFRLQSDFDGAMNFSLGANYTKFDVLVDYYVFYNVISAYAQIRPFTNRDTGQCFVGFDHETQSFFPNPSGDPSTPGALCPYVDPNPIESIDGQGHNYFRSKNPYHLKAASVFGELYWNIREDLKITAGLRYNDDRKRFTPVPSQVLTMPLIGLGTTNIGYPEEPDIEQHWGEITGRLGVDWKPSLSFTNETMIYALYSRGYKGGGANPPGIGFAPSVQALLPPKDYEPTFEPEFVNAFELGAKNVLLDGGLVLNGNLFFYDYTDYQISQIKDRTAVNENFDAKAWGAELQAIFSPSPNFQMLANIGYLDTEVAAGERSIDIMNRTQGDPNYLLLKPWPQLPSNCIAPLSVVEAHFEEQAAAELSVIGGYFNFCGPNGYVQGGNYVYDPATGEPYDPGDYPEINGGAGLYADLGGNELPNAPHWTVNVGAQYGWELLKGWQATVRGDAYWQSQSWHRVYNLGQYDKLHGWYNVNLSLWIERPDDDLKVELYAKNLLDKTPITDAFLNSDDTALTTNVFVLDPRLIGLSIRKGF